MKKRRKIAALLAIVLMTSALCGCLPRRDSYRSRIVIAMDTEICIYVAAQAADIKPLLDGCEELIYQIEGVISRTLKDSEVYRLNESGSLECSALTRALISISKSVAAVSGGGYDPTVAPLIDLWEDCAESGSLPTEAQLGAALAGVGIDNVEVDGETVTLKNGARLDLGGIGKGYAEQAVVDYITERAGEYRVSGGIVDFGGMIAVFGQKADGSDYRIELKNPDNTSDGFGTVTVKSGYIAVSGDYERYVTIDGVKYHHIVDPSDGYPADSGLRSVAVICGDGAFADALSTALFVMGCDKAMELYGGSGVLFEAVFYLSDGSVRSTPGAVFSAG